MPYTRIKPALKKITLLALGVFIFLSPPAHASEKNSRQAVLALFDSTESINRSLDYNIVHRNAEMALNYLGLKVYLHDIAAGLPDEKKMEGVFAIISWFKDSQLPHAEDYCYWAAAQAKKGKKFIVLGNFGAFKDSLSGKETPLAVINESFHALGLEYGGDWTDNPFLIELVEKDSRMVEFERTLENELGEYERVVSLNDKNKVYLSLRRSDIPGSASDLVVVTPYGGFAADSYEIFIDYISDRRQWRIDPFLFFEQALGIEGRPRYDTTTLFGSRIFYSHVDGDGVRNVSSIDKKSYCGRIMLEEIFKRYDLPVTVSFITCDIDKDYFGSEPILAVAKQILELKNIESGNHSFSHPLDWQRMLTAYVIRGYSKKIYSREEQEILSESPYGEAALITVSKEEFFKREIEGSSRYINRELNPAGKNLKIFQWTGNCLPQARAVALARDLGIQNINGGDTRFDRENPSYTAVAPLARHFDLTGLYQVYTSNSNENIYTNGWLGPYDGFKYVIDTFRQTEIPTLVKAPPRRVAPINIYYHFFSAEKVASLEALKEVYDYALTQEIIPVFASHYAKIVNDFFAAQADGLPGGGWEFSGYGDCRTVRFDQKGLYPDLKKSSGIIGFNQWHGSLYVHLADAQRAVLFLSKESPQEPYLKKASAVLSALRADKEEVSFTTRAFGRAVYEFANLAAVSRYAATACRKGIVKPEFSGEFISDEKGDLKVEIFLKGDFNVTIKKIP